MKKFLSFIILLVLVFALSSCNKKEKEIDWDSKVISNVELVQETFDKEYQYDEFSLDLLKLHVSYEDNMSRDIPVTDFMLSDKDLNKLKTFGNPRITIEYEGFEFTVSVHLVDLGLADENLNKSGEYGAVIKAIRDNDYVLFYLDAYSEVASLSFAYTYDNSIMQLSDAVMDSNLKGLGKVEIKDGKIMFAYSEKGTTLNTTDIVLFKAKITGDFRTSNLAVDVTFDNVCYAKAESDYTTTKVINVLYHASTK